MTVSISLVVIGKVIFNLLIWSWFNFGKWYLSRKLSISFTFSKFVEYRFLNYDLMILWFSSVSLIISPFSFVILLIWIFFLYRLVVDFVDFFKETAPCFIDSLYCSLCFYFIDFSPQFDYFLLFTFIGCDFFLF